MSEKFPESDPIPEEQEIKEIEGSSLEVDKKLDLVLVSLGEKDVAWLGSHQIVREGCSRKEVLDTLKSEKENIDSLLDVLDIPHQTTKEVNPGEDIPGFGIAAGKDPEKLREFVEADQAGDDKTMGYLLGYPKTAVEAYDTDKSMNFQVFFEKELSRDEREALLAEGVTRFLGFQPSKKHWREELEDAREKQRLIKEKAPKLYSEIMENDFYLL